VKLLIEGIAVLPKVEDHAFLAKGDGFKVNFGNHDGKLATEFLSMANADLVGEVWLSMNKGGTILSQKTEDSAVSYMLRSERLQE